MIGAAANRTVKRFLGNEAVWAALPTVRKEPATSTPARATLPGSPNRLRVNVAAGTNKAKSVATMSRELGNLRLLVSALGVGFTSASLSKSSPLVLLGSSKCGVLVRSRLDAVLTRVFSDRLVGFRPANGSQPWRK